MVQDSAKPNGEGKEGSLDKRSNMRCTVLNVLVEKLEWDTYPSIRRLRPRVNNYYS